MSIPPLVRAALRLLLPEEQREFFRGDLEESSFAVILKCESVLPITGRSSRGQELRFSLLPTPHPGAGRHEPWFGAGSESARDRASSPDSTPVRQSVVQSLLA